MANRFVRRFVATAYKGAELASRVEASNAYGVRVSQAQSHVNGFVGGKSMFMNLYEPED